MTWADLDRLDQNYGLVRILFGQVHMIGHQSIKGRPSYTVAGELTLGDRPRQKIACLQGRELAQLPTSRRVIRPWVATSAGKERRLGPRFDRCAQLCAHTSLQSSDAQGPRMLQNRSSSCNTTTAPQLDAGFELCRGLGQHVHHQPDHHVLIFR